MKRLRNNTGGQFSFDSFLLIILIVFFVIELLFSCTGIDKSSLEKENNEECNHFSYLKGFKGHYIELFSIL